MPRPAILCAMLVAATLSLVGCTQPPSLQSIQVTPNGASLTTIGETVQFKAIGTYQRGGNHPSTTTDITSQVAWASSDVKVSTISSSGLGTATGSGSTMITASMNSKDGVVLGNSTVTVNVTGAVAQDLISIAVIPSSQTVTTLGEPSQFIAIGTYNTNPRTLDLTTQVSWQSSDVKVSTISSTGLALGNSFGTATITAIGKTNSGATITGTATLTESASGGGVVLPALTVYAVGLGSGTVVSSPAVINCTSGNGCTANFPLGTTVTLTATPATGSTFGGWSSNCIPITGNSCSITLNNNVPVGAIFN
jgi:hypothetical protein